MKIKILKLFDRAECTGTKGLFSNSFQSSDSEDSGLKSSKERSSNMSFCEAPEQNSSVGIEDIHRQAEELVENINQSRRNDQRVMDEFQDKLVEKVIEMCQQMKGHMHMIYKENSDEMQVKLQELSKVLENCSKLQNELLEATQALSQLKEDLTVTHKSN